jgi:hypothetical protein
LGFTVNFYGTVQDTIFVNNNGNVTFTSGLGTFTPFALTGATDLPIIAPFFADVDTRNLASEQVMYGPGMMDGRTAWGATYQNVGYYNSRADKLNSFQVILTDRSDVGPGDFDIMFRHNNILWETETGDASGGSNGFGGSSARAGFSAGSGDPGTFFELPGSGVNGAFLNGGPNALVSGMFNSSDPGVYLFEVRNGETTLPGLTPNDPFLPNAQFPGGPGQPPVFFFGNVPGARWFDPPLVSSYTYTGVGGTLFSAVQFPSGFGDAFLLTGAGCLFPGTFAGMTLIDLTAFCGGPIASFTVSGINPLADAGDPLGFPTYLEFAGGPTAIGSFNMQGNVDAQQVIPEPGTLALTLIGLAAGVRSVRNRRRRAH